MITLLEEIERASPSDTYMLMDGDCVRAVLHSVSSAVQLPRTQHPDDPYRMYITADTKQVYAWNAAAGMYTAQANPTVPALTVKDTDTGRVDDTGIITFSNAVVTQGDDVGKAVVSVNPLFIQGDTDPAGVPAPTLTLRSPLRVSSRASGAMLEIRHDAFEPMHDPSYLAYLSTPVSFRGKGTFWFDNEVTPAGPYILTDSVHRSYGIQEADDSDPATSGGTNYLIAFRVDLDGVAPSAGAIRLHLQALDGLGNPTGYLLDANGNPVGVERQYKPHDNLGVLDVLAVVNAGAVKQFSCGIEHTFTSPLPITTRAGSYTGLLIQALGPTAKTGPALQQFELDTAKVVNYRAVVYGPDRASLDWDKAHPFGIEDVDAGTVYTTAGGLFIHPDQRTHVITDSAGLTATSSAIDPAGFIFGKVFPTDETHSLRGSSITASVIAQTNTSAYRVAMLKWVGDPHEYNPNIGQRNAVSGLMEYSTGWSEVSNVLMPKNTGMDATSCTYKATVPTDAVNYAVVMYPEVAATPLAFKVFQFDVAVDTPVSGYFLYASAQLSEVVLANSEEHARLSMPIPAGYNALRYTLNATPSTGIPLPVGTVASGKADVVIDTSINRISGYAGEGAIKFLKASTVTVATSVQVYPGENVPANTGATVQLWYSRVKADGTFIKIPESEFTTHLGASALPSILDIPKFTIPVAAGERIALFGLSNMADGAFLRGDMKSAPLIQTNLTVDVAVTVPVDDPFKGMDLSAFTAIHRNRLVVTKDFKNQASAIIPVVIPAGATMSVLEVVKLSTDGSVRPVAKLDYVYHTDTKILNVSFGETVLDGRITIGVYL